MPTDENPPVDVPIPGEPEEVGPGEEEMADSVVDASVHVAALTGLSAEAAACSGRRLARADQLQGDSDRMWAVHMTTPTVFAGMGFRVAQQSGGYPANSGTGTGN
jgi:hypothetical protein